MANVNYQLLPQYGMEPYSDNGGKGGAVITDKNLLIGTWQSVDPSGATPFVLLKPNSVNDTLFDTITGLVIPGIQPSSSKTASLQGFSSRYSTRFFFQQPSDANPFVDQVLCVLNPPVEYKQMLAGAVKYNGGPVDNFASYMITKPLQGQYAWRIDGCLSGVEQNFPLSSASNAFFSTYLPNVGINVGGLRIPLLKTNGADGVSPVYFDPFTPAGVDETISAVDKGEFYVALFVQYPPGPPPPVFRTDITWPHSAARG